MRAAKCGKPPGYRFAHPGYILEHRHKTPLSPNPGAFTIIFGCWLASRVGNMDYHDLITTEPGKRGGRPIIRGMRIGVADVLGWLAAGMTHAQIIADYPELTESHIRACLAYAADRERRLVTAAK